MYGAGGRPEDSQVASTGKRRSCSIFEELRVVLMAPGEERCGEALAPKAVSLKAQSCWSQHKWTGDGRSSPCLLANYLQCLSVEEKKQEQMPFPLFVVLIPILRKYSFGLTAVSNVVVKMFFYVSILTDLFNVLWWNMLFLLLLRDKKIKKGLIS